VQGFWPAEFADLADGPTGCVEVAGVGVYLVGSSVLQGQPPLLRRREGLDQTQRCRALATRS
jgi:hypothetical protein